jgi:hypothetical protein
MLLNGSKSNKYFHQTVLPFNKDAAKLFASLKILHFDDETARYPPKKKIILETYLRSGDAYSVDISSSSQVN